jgi:hypothetical protein
VSALHAPKLHAALEAARTLAAHLVTITALGDGNRDIAWDCTLDCPTPCPMADRLRDADWADLTDDLPPGEYTATPTLWGVELSAPQTEIATTVVDITGYPVTCDGMTPEKSTLPDPWQDFQRKLGRLEPGSLKRELLLTQLLKAVPELQKALAEMRREDANILKGAGISFAEQAEYLTSRGCPTSQTTVSNFSRGSLSSKDMTRKGVATPTRAKKTTDENAEGDR